MAGPDASRRSKMGPVVARLASATFDALMTTSHGFLLYKETSITDNNDFV